MGDAFEILPKQPLDHLPELLIYHDEKDLFVPITDGEEIAERWPNAKLVRTQGLGHHRILRDPEIIQACTEFFSGPKLRQTVAA